jgi:hypothetical protein
MDSLLTKTPTLVRGISERNSDKNNGGGVNDGGGGGDSGNFVMFNMDAVIIADISVDHTTLLASSIGSVIGPNKDAFLRSITLRIAGGDSSVINNSDNSKSKNNDLRWDITFSDPVSVTTTSSSSSSSTSSSVSSAPASTILPSSRITPSTPPITSPTQAGGKNRHRRSGSITKMMTSMNKRRSSSIKKQKGVTIASIEGHAALSHICVGDRVTHINGVKIGLSYNTQKCYDLINNMCYDKFKNNGILSIQTSNDNGLDTVLQATVLKPYPKATAKELGIEVWWWRGLVVRDIKANSLFCQSGLKMDDELESINGISLTYNDKITAENFNRIIQELPCDITLVVKRRKHRVSGGFE